MNFLLNDKVEAALALLVRTAMLDPDVMVTTGKSAEGKSIPIVVCSADGDGESDPPGTGNFWVNARVEIKVSAADDSKASDQALVETVFVALMVPDLPAQLSAAVPDLTVFPQGVFFGAPESGRDEAGVWIDALPLRIYCCGSALAA